MMARIFSRSQMTTESMSALPKISGNRSALLAAISIIYCVASGLTWYSDGRIAATVGDRYPSAVEKVTIWTSLVLQPLAVVACLIDSAYGSYVLYSSIPITMTTSLVSACFLFLFLRWLLSRWPRLFFPAYACLILLATISIHTFKIDMKIANEAIEYHDGP
jgi:hypothetical protein